MPAPATASDLAGSDRRLLPSLAADLDHYDLHWASSQKGGCSMCCDVLQLAAAAPTAVQGTQRRSLPVGCCRTESGLPTRLLWLQPPRTNH